MQLTQCIAMDAVTLIYFPSNANATLLVCTRAMAVSCERSDREHLSRQDRQRNADGADAKFSHAAVI